HRPAHPRCPLRPRRPPLPAHRQRRRPATAHPPRRPLSRHPPRRKVLPAMTNRFTLALFAALAVTLGAHGEAPRLDEVIITATRVPEAAAELIGNSAAIDGDALAMTAHVHIQEALARLPGVGIHRNNGQEYLPAIRSPVLTGAGACGSFLVAEDGIPLRPAGFCNVNELFEAHSEAASRIEVIRGPGNALYGSNALHGVINVIAPARFASDWRMVLEGGPN